MATRTSDLTEYAKPVADRLAARCGSLKKVLSAAVLAFDALDPQEREFFMALADGKNAEVEAIALEVLRPAVEKIVKRSQARDAKQRQKVRRGPSRAG